MFDNGISINRCCICLKMFAAVQMGTACKLIRDLLVKYRTTMAKDLSQCCRCSRQWLGRRGWTSNVPQLLDVGIEQGIFDDLYCLGATTCKFGGDLAVRDHGLAESGESICNQDGNVVFCHEV